MIVFEKSKSANFFFFLYTLTECHFTCRKEYKEAWLKNIKITNEKERILKELSNIFKEDIFGDKKLYNYFLIENDQSVYLDDDFLKEKIKEVNEGFKIFRDDFERFWNKEENSLNQITNWLEKTIKEGDHKNIYNNLKIFFDNKIIEDFKVLVLKVPSEVKDKGGGSVLSRNIFTLEIPTLEYAKDSIFVLLHEIAHVFIEENNILKDFNIEKINIPEIFNGRNKRTFFEEFLLISFLPRGYFKIDKEDAENIIVKKEKTWINLRNYIIKSMYKINDKYIVSNKKIDNEYIKNYSYFLEKFF
jgi:hypothetical protein